MKQKVIILLVSAILVMPALSGCSQSEAYQYSQKNVKTSVVTKKQTEDFLTFSGNLEGNKETVVASKISGKISSIKVNIGDKIKKKELLVTLSGEENFSTRNTAGDTYQNSLASLENTDYQMNQEINKAEASLESARQSLASIKTADLNEDLVSSEQIEQAKLDLEKAKIAKNSIDSIFAQKEKDVLENIDSVVSQSLLVSKNSLAYLYLINNEDFSSFVDDFNVDNNFVSDTDTRNQTSALIKKAKTEYFDIEKSYTFLSRGEPSRGQSMLQVDLTENVLGSVGDALRAMNTIVLSAVNHVNMTESQLSSYRASLSNYISQIDAMLLSQDSGVAIGLLGSRQAMDNLQIEKSNQLKQINKDIEKSLKQLEVIHAGIASLKDDLKAKTEIAKSQLDLAKGNLASTKAQHDTQVQIAKSRVDMARGGLNIANVSVSNTMLRAPYNGVVMERLVDEGAIVNAGTPILKVADISSYKLVIFVPESQVWNIKIGQIATATTDSLIDKRFKAVVRRISPKSEEGSKKVRVELEIKNSEYLKIGMYMDLRIQNTGNLNTDILVVPFDALVMENNKNYIWKVKDNKAYKKEIELGQTNSLEVEVRNGVELGEEIIYKGLESLIEGEEVVIKN